MPRVSPSLKTYERYFEDADLKKRVDHMFASAAPHIKNSVAKHQLKLRPWYDHLPLWLIETEATTGEVEPVNHVGAAVVKGVLYLAVAVDAYRDDVDSLIRHSLGQAKAIKRVSEKKVEAEPAVMSEAIDNAYSIAQQISEEELVKTSSLQPV